MQPAVEEREDRFAPVLGAGRGRLDPVFAACRTDGGADAFALLAVRLRAGDLQPAWDALTRNRNLLSVSRPGQEPTQDRSHLLGELRDELLGSMVRRVRVELDGEVRRTLTTLGVLHPDTHELFEEPVQTMLAGLIAHAHRKAFDSQQEPFEFAAFVDAATNGVWEAYRTVACAHAVEQGARTCTRVLGALNYGALIDELRPRGMSGPPGQYLSVVVWDEELRPFMRAAAAPPDRQALARAIADRLRARFA